MREIKFRAWDKQNKKMLSSSEFLHKDLYLTLGGGIMCVNPVGNQYAIAEECYPIMQYTGLKDKNGKEIYEGDIMQNEQMQKTVIIWSNDELGFMMVDIEEYPKEEPTYMTNDIWVTKEIIGNIYENPELLKQ